MSRKGFKKLDRIDALKLFTKLENGEHVKNNEIEYFKVKAFTLEPGQETSKKAKPGMIIVDGERVDYLPLSVESFCGIATVVCEPPKPKISSADLV